MGLTLFEGRGWKEDEREEDKDEESAPLLS
jgi:hypothetical protein